VWCSGEALRLASGDDSETPVGNAMLGVRNSPSAYKASIAFGSGMVASGKYWAEADFIKTRRGVLCVW
jgi:hypothetical protein